jgi:UDP:flavonoid glycosyltransferase YjiC (YdhE family)
MRVLFTSLPATGHFNSLLPLAEAVADAGHDVAFCCTPAFAGRVTDAGFEHLPGGAETFEELFVGAPPRTDRHRVVWAHRVGFAGRAVEAMLPDLELRIGEWKPQIIVRETAEYAGCLAAEKLGLPHAAVATGSRSARTDSPRIVVDVLDGWRQRLGLEPDPAGEMAVRNLVLSFMPESWDGPGVHPPSAQFIRYENPRVRREASPPLLDVPRDRPLVLVSLGTVHHREAGILDANIEAVAGEPVDVIAATGAESSLTVAAPANVRLEAFVPQVAVLELASAFITHGGFNSAKEALSLGVPLVVVPITADQPYTAERVEALGLGLRVGPDERTPEVIRTRLREVLGDPAYGERTRAFATEMAALPGADHAVRLLERLVAEHA